MFESLVLLLIIRCDIHVRKKKSDEKQMNQARAREKRERVDVLTTFA